MLTADMRIALWRQRMERLRQQQETQALGLMPHPLPTRVRLAVERAKRGPFAPVVAFAAAFALWLDAQMRRAA